MLKNQHEGAHEAADGAVALLRPLAGAIPTSDLTTRDRWLLCLALTDRGIASRGAGEHDRALHDFDEAEEVASRVLRDEEAYDDAQFQIACISNQRGELLCKDLSRFPESEKNYERATRILERLIEDHKLIPHYREELAVTSSGRAAARLAMGRIPDAERDCKAALDHLAWLVAEQARKGAPENPQYLSLLGQVRTLEGRIHRAGTGDRGPQGVCESGREPGAGAPDRPCTGDGQGDPRSDQGRLGSVGTLTPARIVGGRPGRRTAHEKAPDRSERRGHELDNYGPDGIRTAAGSTSISPAPPARRPDGPRPRRRRP